MTTHLKTVRYAFAESTTVTAAAGTTTLSTLTVTLPETTGRSFQSVMMLVRYKSSVTAGTSNTTAPVVTLKLGSATTFSYTVTIDTGNGLAYNDGQVMEHWVDVTGNFISNFGAGSSQTAVATLKVPVASTNVSVQLFITYQYDDSNTTRVKTVMIPLEGGNSSLITSLTLIGGAAEIPNLSTLLPENTVTITDCFFEVTACIRNPGSNFAVTLALDSETGVTFGTTNTGSWTGTGSTGLWACTWKRTDMSSSATHAFKAKTSVASSVYNLTVVLVVTYTYNHSATSTVLNSILVPFNNQYRTFDDVTSLAYAKQVPTEFWVEEPGPVGMVQSAVHLRYGWGDTGQLQNNQRLKVGSQASFATFAPTMNDFFVGINSGQLPLQLRCDTASSGGAGFTLARGKNTTNFTYYCDGTAGSDINRYGIVQAFLYLNYTSSLHANGDGVHNHSVFWCLLQDTNTQFYTRVTGSVSVPEFNWWLNGFVPRFKSMQLTFLGLTTFYTAGDPLQTTGSFGSLETISPAGSKWDSVDGKVDVWQRFSGDPSTNRVNPFVNRYWSIPISAVGGGESHAFGCWFTYHAITFTIAGVVNGYTGNGSGVIVNAHRADTGELIASSSTVAGGSYTMIWFDNTQNVFTEAWQDNTHIGRSTNGTAV